MSVVARWNSWRDDFRISWVLAIRIIGNRANSTRNTSRYRRSAISVGGSKPLSPKPIMPAMASPVIALPNAVQIGGRRMALQTTKATGTTDRPRT